MRNTHRLAFLLLLPSFVFTALFSLYPIIDSFRLSFYRLILTLPWLGQKMVGLENYSDLVSDPVARQSLSTTLILAARPFRGTAARSRHCAGAEPVVSRRGLMRAIVLIPGNSHSGFLRRTLAIFV